MWQGKSMIPKPRLTTPRRTDRPPSTLQTPTPSTPSRTPARTPSRIPRPPSRLSGHTSNKSMSRQQTTPLIKRGDKLAEHVIATGIIASHNPHQQSDHESDSFKSFRKSSQLFQPDSQHNPTTPPRNLVASHIPHSHLSNHALHLTTPERHTPSREMLKNNAHQELVIDEELVTRTPAKHKNSEWLASFGIDISLLNITDDDHDEENQHPNITPSPDFSRNDSEIVKSCFNADTTRPHAFQRRRATDFYGYAQSTHENLPGPTRISSARKSRRASARISVRELDALKYKQGVDADVNRFETVHARKGSDVFLTPVRATRKQREKNGTPVVLSEVRRSLRINTPSSKLVPKNSVRGRIELLEANDHSYIPNPTLNDRATLSG